MSAGLRYRRSARSAAQRGVSLIVALLMLVVVMLLGISASHISLQGEKTSRNERDRQVALQSAEAALMDAELDIENSPDQTRSRSKIFINTTKLGFPEGDEITCAAGIDNVYLGLCNHASGGVTPAWATVDFMEQSSSAATVPFGRFTGQAFQTGAGSLPARPSRYVIEPLEYQAKGELADTPTYVYRITAIGFGVHETTQVLLQSIYRKEN